MVGFIDHCFWVHREHGVTVCFFASLGFTGCEGRMDRAHLIAQQVIKREVGRSKTVLQDPRVWVPACRGHHFRFDYSRTVRLRRDQLPAGVEEYAAEHGLGWRLDHDYGPLEAAA